MNAGFRPYHHGYIPEEMLVTLRLMIENGEYISLRAACHSMRISSAAIYRHYASRDDLMEVVIKSYLQEWIQILSEASNRAQCLIALVSKRKRAAQIVFDLCFQKSSMLLLSLLNPNAEIKPDEVLLFGLVKMVVANILSEEEAQQALIAYQKSK